MPPGAPFFQQLSSSIHNHVGLLRLWEDFDTDLLTIDDGLWLQRIGLEAYYMGDASDETVLSKLATTRGWAVTSCSVNWDDYDFIFCLDSVVSPAVMQKFPKPVWAIFLSSPCPSLYALRRWAPLYGFSLTLTDQLPEPVLQPGAGHDYSASVRRFPLSFFKSNDLLNLATRASSGRAEHVTKCGIHIEKHCGERLTARDVERLQAFGPVSCGVPREEYFRTMASRKYFIISHDSIRYLKGHSIIEANGFGSLSLVKQGVRLEMATLVCETMTFQSFDDLIARLSIYECDATAFTDALLQQQKHIDRYAYELPKQSLERLIQQHRTQQMIKQGPWQSHEIRS